MRKENVRGEQNKAREGELPLIRGAYDYVALTDCDMILAMTICDVSEEANENGLPEKAEPSSGSPGDSVGAAMWPPSPPVAVVALEEPGSPAGRGGTRAFETSKADRLQERERNSMGSLGVSGGLNMAGSGRHGSISGFSMAGF